MSGPTPANRSTTGTTKVPSGFIGMIENLTAALNPPKLTPEDEKKLMEAAARANDGPKHMQSTPM
jgi:hypothetical protein